jgi:CHAT domain-containing protein
LIAQATEITTGLIGTEHRRFVRCLSIEANLHRASGDDTAATKARRKALELSRRQVELASHVQSERQQLAMTTASRASLDSFLSVALDGGVSAEEAYGHVLAWKGSVFQRQRNARIARNEPELAPTLRELRSVSSRLAALALRAPKPTEAEAWRTRTDALRDRQEQLEGEVVRKSSRYRRDKALMTVPYQAIAAALPENTAIVDYVEYDRTRRREKSGDTKKGATPLTTNRQLIAFVVRKGRPISLVDLGPLEPIEASINLWRKMNLADRSDDSSVSILNRNRIGGVTARTLKVALWEPMRRQLAGATQVLVSPDGALARFPLGALPGRKKGRYLIEDVSIGLVASASIVTEILRKGVDSPRRSDARATNSLLLVGDVDFDRRISGALVASNTAKTTGDPVVLAGVGGLRGPATRTEGTRWPRLDFTAKEIQSLEKSFTKAFAKGRVQTLRGASASENAFRDAAPRHRYVHLATHGFFSSADLRAASNTRAASGGATSNAGSLRGWSPGLLSGIVFSGANGEPSPDGDDGLLTALELAPLDLDETELLVLSACETGLGATAGGEGLFGIQRAAQVAGADAVIASLWRVGDSDAAALMGRFYENLWSRKMSKLEALREAQIAFLRGTIDSASVAKLRGPGKVKPRVKGAGLEVPRSVWAAWVLSGDWR